MSLRPLLCTGLLFFGCAAPKVHIRDPDRIEEEREAHPEREAAASPSRDPSLRSEAAAVRLVSREPSKERWELIGKIEGTSPSDDTLRAGALAEKDLRRKAALLGAALVKIDQVTPPGDTGRRGRVVVFTARAFRERAQD